ncbi:hypothetical protein B0H13DRAFT_1892517 [Mycena leptocephala]|nr:hypothetical protein B0H13DRAFT_1892517 [Mycena leptocephala]
MALYIRRPSCQRQRPGDQILGDLDCLGPRQWALAEIGKARTRRSSGPVCGTLGRHAARTASRLGRSATPALRFRTVIKSAPEVVVGENKKGGHSGHIERCDDLTAQHGELCSSAVSRRRAPRALTEFHRNRAQKYPKKKLDCTSGNMARGPRRRSRVASYFDPRNLRGRRDSFAALKNLCNPFKNDAPGYVYIISSAEYRAISQVKVGHAKDFETRQRAYAKCEVDWVLIWEMKLWTPHHMLLEALIHESLRRRNATIPRVRCSCSKEHREFFDLVAAGGVDGVEKIALRWMYLIGQALTVKSVGYDAN